MAEVIIELVKSIFHKCNENLSTILVLMSIILILRFVFVVWGFDLMSVVIAVMLLFYSFMVDLKRSKQKQRRNSRGD